MGGSWRNVIWLFTGITLMFGLFAIFTISKLDLGHADVASAARHVDKSVKVPAEFRRSMWSLAVLYAGTMGTSVAVSDWLPTLMAERGYDTVTAGNIASFQTVGALATALLVPLFFERLLRNTLTTPIAGLAVLGIVMTILSSQTLFLIKAAALCAGIAFNFLSLHAQRDIISSAPEHVSGKYVSTINACANCSGVMSVNGHRHADHLAGQAALSVLLCLPHPGGRPALPLGPSRGTAGSSAAGIRQLKPGSVNKTKGRTRT